MTDARYADFEDTMPTAPTPLEAASAADELTQYDGDELDCARGICSLLAITGCIAAVALLIMYWPR